MGNHNPNRFMPHFLGIGVLMAFILPHTSMALMLVNPLLCIAYKLFSKKKILYKWGFIVIFPILFTLLVNIPQTVETKSIISCFTILLYIYCFPMIVGVRPPNSYFYAILITILVSQLTYLLNIPILTGVLDTYYPNLESEEAAISYMRDHITSSNYMDFRMGGLYRNSNHCARSLTMLMATFIILNKDRALKWVLPFTIICFSAIMLTGSRTGFFVASVIVLGYLYKDKRVSTLWRYVFFGLAFVAFIYLISTGSDTVRGLNVAEGMNDSFSYKFNTFLYYLNNESSIFRLLFGYLDYTRFVSGGAGIMNKFDCDYGEMIFCYGFVGFIAFVTYFYKIYKELVGVERIFGAVALWIFSSTIVTSFRAFFMFMLLLSIIYTCRKCNYVEKNKEVKSH